MESLLIMKCCLLSGGISYVWFNLKCKLPALKNYNRNTDCSDYRMIYSYMVRFQTIYAFQNTILMNSFKLFSIFSFMCVKWTSFYCKIHMFINVYSANIINKARRHKNIKTLSYCPLNTLKCWPKSWIKCSVNNIIQKDLQNNNAANVNIEYKFFKILGII